MVEPSEENRSATGWLRCGPKSPYFFIKIMLTKKQKIEQVALGLDKIKKSQTLIFADFTGVPDENIKQLKVELRKKNANYKVFKKRLLKIALKDAGIDFDPMQYDAQVGTIFAEGDLSSVAAPIYKFSKDLAKAKKDFKVLGVYDISGKAYLGPAEFAVVAKLPSREVLLAMVIGAMTGPLKAFMYIIDQLSKKSPSSAEASAGQPSAVEAVAPVAAAAEAAPTASVGGDGKTVEQK